MVEVVVFAEGQTEEKFIKQVVAPEFRPRGIFVKPKMLSTSREAMGGAVSFQRLKYYARNTLRMSSDSLLTTFLDLYGLDTDFPSFSKIGKQKDVYARVACLEKALHRAVVEEVGCREDRFIPHIQPFEFEGLLFSDVAALCGVESGWKNAQAELAKVRDAHESPEHINDSYDTKPSLRLEKILSPKYRKARHGPSAAKRITLTVMERECRHFGEWMEKLRKIVVQEPVLQKDL